jgi:hypothetical protein
LLQR